MSELERETIKNMVEAMTLEEKKQVLAVFPSEMLFDELKIREQSYKNSLAEIRKLAN